MGKPAYTVSEARRVRYIIHTDCKNEADDQYTVAHCLLTPLFEVRGIIAAHFNNSSGRYPDGATAKASYDEMDYRLTLEDLFAKIMILAE